MKLKTIKILFTILLSFVYAANLSAAEDVDWSPAKEPIYENGSGSAVIGTRWAIASRREDVQMTLRLEALTDMTKGGWLGDVRAPEKFFVRVYLVDENDNRVYLKVKNAKVIGPDTEHGSWKKGPSTTEQQMLIFGFSWDKLNLLKNSKAVILNYSSYDNPDNKRDITFPLDTFNARLDEVEASIRSVDGGHGFVMTTEEINKTPLVDLPIYIQETNRAQLKSVSEILSIPVDELAKLSKNEVQTLLDNKAKVDKEEKLAARRKAHKAIYDQEPNWLDMNICPKPDVEFCRNVGKNAYEDDRMFSDLTHEYGKILGVVWRSAGSIMHIYGGSIEYNFDPEIIRTKKAAYYCIVKKDEGQVNIRACDGLKIKY